MRSESLDLSKQETDAQLIRPSHLVAGLNECGVSLLSSHSRHQVWYELNGHQDPMSYKSPAAQKLYSRMRHPGVGCLLMVLWAHPVMSLGRWFLAASWTLYLLLGFGVQHQDYVYITHQVSHQRSATRRTIEIVE